MHPLMPPVLFRMRRADALELDAKAQPVSGELREISPPARGERNPIVGAHCLRQSIPTKNVLAGLACLLVGDGSHRIASEDEAAALVRHRQRVTERLVPETELPLV